MVVIVTQANRALYEDALQDMFEMRYRTAVEELKWNLPHAHTGIDIDEYDRDETVYFLKFGAKGDVVACARLNPTTSPNLMRDIFVDFCTMQGVPEDPDVYELSRYLVEKTGRTREEFLEGRAEIIVAINEFCLASNIHQVSWLTYKQNYAEACLLWETEPLGLPVYMPDDDAEYIAAISNMNETGLEKCRRWAQVSGQVSSMVIPVDFSKGIDLPKRMSG